MGITVNRKLFLNSLKIKSAEHNYANGNAVQGHLSEKSTQNFLT